MIRTMNPFDQATFEQLERLFKLAESDKLKGTINWDYFLSWADNIGDWEVSADNIDATESTITFWEGQLEMMVADA